MLRKSDLIALHAMRGGYLVSEERWKFRHCTKLIAKLTAFWTKCKCMLIRTCVKI